jgi:REP element-mobilizing transposase RayT
MARPLRIQYEGAAYHIISRGNRAEYIFTDDKDKEYFIETIKKAAEKYKAELYAYCIMGNHYHLLLTTPYGELTKLMHYIGSAYGSYQRRQHGVIGHIFAGRYKSLCIEKEQYLLELSRYIHLNPVKAGITDRAEDYKWSSYRYYIGKEESPEWLNTGWLMEEYGKEKKKAYQRYKEFTEAGIKNPSLLPKEKIIGQAILGSKEFIKKIIKEIKKKAHKDITGKRIYRGIIDLEELKDRVCRHYGVKELSKPETKQEWQARRIFINLAKEKTTAYNRDIADIAGYGDSSAVTHQYKRTLHELKADRRLLRQWEAEKGKIMS